MSCGSGTGDPPIPVHALRAVVRARLETSLNLFRFRISPPARRTAVTATVCAAVLLASSAVPALADAGTRVVAANDIPAVIKNLQDWLIGILAGLATLFLVLGGVRYVISNGNPGEVEKAKTAFKSAAIGYCLAVLAPIVIAILKSIVGGPS